ncbi:MAG: leucyl/phenylalanyl-tRNA--protein transferase [Bacteroidetes bacterium]|nr:leucyl/phenylalanyl-tRNA--protein transferase [Bacteroidota bacterium]
MRAGAAADRSGETSLDPALVIMAYCRGYFPMADPQTGSISWYSPDSRAIIPLEGFNVPRSVRRTLRRGMYDLRVDTAFDAVIRSCAARHETWISGEIIRVYGILHGRGFAHSVEAWHKGELAGGLYGVAIRGAFFGESMFSHRPDASKAALVRLVDLIRRAGFVLLDTQFITDHLKQFGACEIPREQYLELLASALKVEARLPTTT